MPAPEFKLDADVEISLAELDYIEAKYAAEKENGEVTSDTHFMYAWALLRSRYRDDRELSIKLLLEILQNYPERRRESLFYLALANYKIGEFRTGLKYIQELLALEPNNSQALQLKEKIESKITNDGLMGMAMVGGITAAAVGALIAAYRLRRK